MAARIGRLALVALAALAPLVILGTTGCSPAPPSTAGQAIAPVVESAPQPDPNAVDPAAPTAPSGIVAISFGDSTNGVSPSYVELSLIDPESGSAEAWNSFEEVDDARIAFENLYGDGIYTPFRARMLFSPDYDRIAAARTGEDGSEHVGWITSDGEYVDVTDEVTGDQSDFDEPVLHRSPRFGPDGTFYFLDANAMKVKKVDPENLTSDALKSVKSYSGNSSYGLDVYPNGVVAVLGQLRSTWHIQNTARGVYTIARVEDWIDATSYLTSDLDMLGDMYGGGAKRTSGIYASKASRKGGSARKAIVPERGSRRNWNPIASPDGKTIAFLSCAGNQVEPELFTVSRKGGEPAKVDAGFTFIPAAAAGPGSHYYRLQLLDWL